MVVSIFGRGGTAGNPNVLLGIEGIKQAQGLSQDAKNLLLLHARTLPPNEVDHYIVNPQLAEQWFKTHPVPPSVKKAAEGGRGGGGTNCTVATDNIGGLVSHPGECAQQGVQHASEELARQSEALRKQAGDEWRHVSDEATHDWKMTEDCFADHTLHVSDIPVQFSILPQFPLSYQTSGKKALFGGTASGKVSGQVNIGIPVDADFNVKLDLFYIPCLPFAIRPRMIAGDGTLTVGSKLDGTVKADGQFKDTFTIPPTGGPKIPIQVYAIVIGGVPVSELDVSLYLEGTVYVEADGALDGSFSLENRQKTAFLFECTGAGCYSISHAKPVPESAAEKLNLKGRVRVKPAFYAALQLDVDWEALSARAGPQPYLLGELSGCSSTSATQTTAGSSTQESYALTADLDWGIELRAEALAGGKKLGDSLIVPILPPHHIAFWDLGGSNPSNALIPSVDGSQQAAVGKPAAYKLKMGSCYPYTDQVTYQVNWTGGATATGNTTPTQTVNTPAAQQQANAARAAVTLNRPFGIVTGAPNSGAPQPPACTLQTDQATCEGNPQKDIALNLVWPQTATGQNTLTVVPVRDKHGRVFTEKPAQVNINVQPSAAGGAGQPCSTGGACSAGLVCQNGICTSKTP